MIVLKRGMLVDIFTQINGCFDMFLQTSGVHPVVLGHMENVVLILRMGTTLDKD